MFHELEVHQIELELQNAELHRARNELEAALESYTDLYDFAPVGYFSVDEAGVIRESNLTGATLLRVERSRLINRRLPLFVAPTSRPTFLAFLKGVFTGTKESSCEALLVKEGGGTFWASFRATPAEVPDGAPKWCRLAFGDITARRQADAAQRRLEALTDSNLGLKKEIVRRRAVEKALQESEQEQRRLLKEARHVHEQMRRLSHQTLKVQEEERKRISRELHDEIAQTLVGINVHLAALTREASGDSKALKQKIARTQRLVEESVEIVHRFARELRPAALDDLGVIPALRSFMKEFMRRTGIRIRFTTFAGSGMAQLSNATRTALYRVAQEALTNVARHAQASAVDVSFENLHDGIRLRIKDNGRSFPAERILRSKRNRRLGLIGMRERMQMVGGSFGVESAPGKGTTVTAEVPLARPK